MKQSIWTKQFWKAAGERALWTIAQSGLATIGITPIAFGDVNWALAGSIALTAGIVSVLKSIVVNGVTESGPSTANAEALTK